MALSRFCPKCGRTVPKDRVFCEECEPSRERETPSIIEIFACDCGRVASSRNSKKWEKHPTITSAIRVILSRELAKKGIRLVDMQYPTVPLEKRMEIPVSLRGVDDKGHEVDIEIRVIIHRTPCPDCSRRAGKYYEATIQVRGEKREVDRVSQEIEDMIDAWRDRDPKSFVTSREDVRGGVDIKLGSKRAASRAAREIKKRENVETKESTELVGRRDGKEVTRKTILIRVLSDKNSERGGVASERKKKRPRKNRKK